MPDNQQPPLFVNPDGAVVSLDPSLAPLAAHNGYVPASPEQVSQYLAQQKYGTTGQSVAAGAEAIGRGLTLGLSTVAERAVGVPAEDIAGREAANPKLAPALEVASAIAPVVLTGGSAAPEEGASLATRIAARTAPSIVNRAGEAAAARVAEALPEATGALGRIGTTGVTEAVNFATQGALQGVGHVVHEAALGDPNLTAGRIISEIGLSTVLSGGLGATLGIAGKTLGEGFAKAADATGALRDLIVERYPAFAASLGRNEADTATLMANREKLAAGVSPEDILREHAPAIPEPVAFKAGEPPAEPAAPTSPAPQEPEAFVGKLRDTLNEHAAQMQKQISGVWAKLKPEEMGPLLADVTPQTAWKEWARLSNQLRDTITTMRSEPDLYEAANTRGMEGILEGLRRDVIGAASEGRGTAEQVYNRIDEAKRLLFDEGKAPIMASRSQTLTSLQAKGMFAAFKDSLQDADVWGEAAVRQTERNAAFRDFKTAQANFDKAFTKQERSLSGATIRVPDSGKLTTFVRNLGEESNAERERYLAQYIDSSNSLLSQIKKTAEMAGAGDYDPEAARAVVDRTSKAIADARSNAAIAQAHGTEEEAHAAAMEAHKQQMGAYRADVKIGKAAEREAQAQYREATQAQDKDLSARAKDLGGGHVGALDAFGLLESVNHPIAAPFYAAYEGAKLAASPSRVVQTLATLEKLNQVVHDRIMAHASALVRAGALASTVGRAEMASGISKVFALSPNDAAKTYRKQTEETASLANNPSKMFGALNGMVQDGLSEHAPDTASALTSTATRGVSFLASKIPQRPYASQWGPNAPPSRQEIATWNNYRTAVEDPVSIVRQAAAGTLTPEAVEAVQAVYPDLMASIQHAVLHQMNVHGDPPVSQWGAIEMLMGTPMFRSVPGSLASADYYASQFIQGKQAAHAKGAAKPHMPGATPKRALNANLTASQRLAAGSTSPQVGV